MQTTTRTNQNSLQIIESDKMVFSKTAMLGLSAYDQMLFEKYGQGPVAEPEFKTIHQAIEYFVQTQPLEMAVEHFDEKITYEELNLQADRLALLLTQYGVRSGDHVALFIERSIPMIVGLLATLKIGAAYVPQDARLAPENQLKHVLKTTQTRVVLTLSKLKNKIPMTESLQMICVDEFMKSDFSVMQRRLQSPTAVNPEQACFVLFTSGTTGLPNGVQVTHKNLCNILLTEPGSMHMRPGLKVSQILNIAFDMAAWEILGCLSHGATLVIRGSDIQKTVSEVDIVIATPSILSQVDISKCQKVKAVAVAGEPCPRALADLWSRKSFFYNSCGPTEVTIVNTMQLHQPLAEKLTIGKPTPNNTVYILDENLNACAIGTVGEMWAGGDCVSAGYVGNDQLNFERYKPDPFLGGDRKMFRTRDLGRWTENGELEHLGRTDDQVKIRGFRVELDSVSTVLESIQGCTQAVTLKLNDRHLVSFVTPKNIDSEVAKQAVAKALPYYCTPGLVIALDELPLTNRGKIDKRSLTAMAVAEEEKNKNTQDLEAHLKTELPPKKNIFTQLMKHPLMMPYNRLAVGMLLINLIIFFKIGATLTLNQVADLVLVNFAIANLIRQEHVINFLFKIATSAPVNWPLKIRWSLAKVYHFGGINVGTFFSGNLWFLYAVIKRYQSQAGIGLLTLMITHMLILLSMMVMALPQIRSRYHNQFEIVARFGTWSSLYLFLAQELIYSKNLIHLFILAIVTFAVALPWLRLKKIKVDITTPSNHVALAKFNYGVTPFAGSSTDLSIDPLFEWHSFANIPYPNDPGFRLTISRAGDWTARLIDQKPKFIYVKGVPAAGVGNIEKLFKRVVFVATGSGIGPCLPHLLAQKVPSQLVWSTKNPRKTYGDEMVSEILQTHPDSIIWDTDQKGKPDMVKLAYKAYQDFNAEAVICIANKKLTWQVVQELESRGIPAFGAIWDS